MSTRPANLGTQPGMGQIGFDALTRVDALAAKTGQIGFDALTRGDALGAKMGQIGFDALLTR